jgi:hypothetical protein
MTTAAPAVPTTTPPASTPNKYQVRSAHMRMHAWQVTSTGTQRPLAHAQEIAGAVHELPTDVGNAAVTAVNTLVG